MAAISLHGFSFFRHCPRRTLILVYFSIIAVCFDSVYCATLSNSSENSSVSDSGNVNHENNSTFSRRQLLSPEHILAVNNPYLHTPSLGFPIYHNLQQFTPAAPFYPIESTSSNKSVPKDPTLSSEKKRTKVKAKPSNKDFQSNVFNEDQISEDADKPATKSKRKKTVRKKEKLQKEVNDLEKVESKTVDEGTDRGCPGCASGTCDPFLDTKVNISGIPVIQILIALAVGAFWAAVFAFILHNFIEYHKEGEEEEGYGYGASPTPEYGAPQAEYGPPQSEYGAPTGYSSSNKRITFPASGYGKRRSQGFTFNDMSKSVWNAIDKLISKYEN